MSTFNQNSGTAVPTLINSSAVLVTGNAVSSNALTVRQFGTGNVVSFSNASGGSNVFVMTNTGRIGIGTTNPSSLLDVRGTTRLVGDALLGTTSGNQSNVIVQIGNGGSGNFGGLKIIGNRTANGSDWTTTSLRIQKFVDATQMGYMEFGASGGIQDIAFGYGSTERMRIKEGGNVGIGTASPQAALQVNGDFLIGQGGGSYSYNSMAIQYDSHTNYGSIIGKGVQWDGTNYKIQTDGANTRCSAIQMSWDSGFRFITTAAGGGSNLTLTPAQFASNVKVAITNGGLVGIGTASPASTLDLSGGTLTSRYIISPSGNYLTIQNGAGGSAISLLGTTTAITGGVVYMTGGNVGIGTASPGYPLHVATSPVSLNGVAFRYFNYTTTVLTQANPGNLGISIYAQGDVVSTTGIVVTSDRRAKVLEEPPTEPYLNLVDKIQVHQYSWIDKIEKSANKKIGFFAQEVEEVVPDAVGKNTDVVPTIYKQADAFTESTITVTNHGLTTEKKLEVVDLENGKTKIDIVRVIDADNLEVKFEKVPKDKLFVVGPEVDDSRLLNHDYLMAVGFGGLKELHALVKSQQTTIEMLTERLAAAGL